MQSKLKHNVHKKVHLTEQGTCESAFVAIIIQSISIKTNLHLDILELHGRFLIIIIFFVHLKVQVITI